MTEEIKSKKQLIKKAKWLRGKINEWGKKFQEQKCQGRDYISVSSREKAEFMRILRTMEFHLEESKF